MFLICRVIEPVRKDNKRFLFVKQKRSPKLPLRNKKRLLNSTVCNLKASNLFNFKPPCDKLFLMKKFEKFGRQGNRAGTKPFEESPDSY